MKGRGGSKAECGMKRILVIDDEPSVAHLIGLSLRAAKVHHTLEYCSDGSQGRVKAAQGGYDLITLDRNMPLVGGAEVLAEIKRSGRSADTPVVIITAQKDPEFQKSVMELGAAALISKPFRPLELARVLSRLLGEGDEPAVGAGQEADGG